MKRTITGAYDSQESFVEFKQPQSMVETNGLLFQENETRPMVQRVGDIWFGLSRSKRGFVPTHRVEVI